MGEIPGHCLLTAAHARDVALAAGSVWRRLVTDPVTGHLVELSQTTYKPGKHLARTVRARDGVSRHPLSGVPAHRTDLDHVEPWPAGITGLSGLVALNRSAHLAKTRGLAETRLLADGTYEWRTLTGRVFTSEPFDHDQTARTVLNPGQAPPDQAHGRDPDDPAPLDDNQLIPQPGDPL